MKARGISSPDEADAFVLSNTSLIYNKEVMSNIVDEPEHDLETVQEKVKEFHNSGFDERKKFLMSNMKRRKRY